MRVTAIDNSFVRHMSAGKKYIDKTQAIFELIYNNRFAFAEANKGAGKTLMLDTIVAAFHQDFESLRYTSIVQKVVHLPYAQILWADGAVWDQKAEQFLMELRYTFPHKNIVVLFDNYHLAQNSEKKELLNLYLSTIKKNAANFRFVLLVAEAGNMGVDEIGKLNFFRNISREAYTKSIFHFSQDEILQYFQSEINLMAVEMELDPEDIIDHLLQQYGSACCDGVSPKGLLDFFAA